METGSFADLSLGILESAIFPDAEALSYQNLFMEDDLNETDDPEADEVDVYESGESALEGSLVEFNQSSFDK